MMLTASDFVPSYWLLGDDKLALSDDPSNKDAFIAHFKHSLLFNPSLLFSDSMVITNRNFRHLIEYDGAFRDLINPTTFYVAIRQDADSRPRNLLEIRRNFRDTGKSTVTELDGSDSGLEFLSTAATPISYSVRSLFAIYCEQSVSLFRSPAVQKQLPYNLWQDVYDLAAEAREREGDDFGRAFFFYRLRDQLVARRHDIDTNTIDHYMARIRELATCPYVTALPNSHEVDTTPIYAPAHAEAFTICGGRSFMDSVGGEREVRSIRLTAGLANFCRGIALLSAQDILELRGKDEASNYFASRLSLNATRFEDSKSAFFEAFGAYVRCIEDRIIQRFTSAKCDDGEVLVSIDVKKRRTASFLSKVPEIFTYVSIGAAVAADTAFSTNLTLPVSLRLLFIRPLWDVATLTLTGKTRYELSRAEVACRDQQVKQLEAAWGNNSAKIDAKMDVINHKSPMYIPNETLYAGMVT